MSKFSFRVRSFSWCALLLTFLSCERACKRAPQDEHRPLQVSLAFPVETMETRYAISATASRLADLVYGSLFRMNEDLSIEPFLAESMTRVGPLQFKVKLRDNLRFHDGSKLTTQDVVYTFAALQSPDVASPQADKFNYVESIKALNEREVIFELKHPYAPFLADLSLMGIVSKKSCENRSGLCRHEYNGSGPFKVKNWDKAKESIHLEPFAMWFEGAPECEVVFRVVRDENTRLLELIGKKVDLVESDISPQSIAELKKQPHLAVSEVPGLGYSYMAFNLRGPRMDDTRGSDQYLTRLALADKRVRQAIAHAIDFDQIIEKILLHTADRVSGLIPNVHWAKDKKLAPLAYDPDRSRSLLDEAGFRAKGPDKMRFKVVLATTPNRARQSISQLYVDYLQKVGIDASIRVKDWGALYQDMQQGNFEIFSANWVPVIEPDLYYWVHHSASIPFAEKGGGNRHAYKNATIDRLVEQGRESMEPLERKTIYAEVERILLDDLPYIPLWNERRIIVQNRDRIMGFTPSITGSFLGLRKALYKKTPTGRA